MLILARRALAVVATGALILWTPPMALAQTNTAQMTGVVRDSSGGVLPGATVTAIQPATGTVVERVVDGEGRFFLPELRIGEWDVTAALAGFAPQVHRGIVLQIGGTVTLDFALSLEGLSEQITVEATAAPLLQSATAEISDVIGNREVVQLPLSQRNFLALAQLSDSVVIPPGGTRGAALGQAGPLPNIGGQRAGHNIYLLDGSMVTDQLFNNLVLNPSIDLIQEFRLQKSMYPAEFGGKASALINVATKAGSNQFHGSLFGFVRNDRFNARNYFAPPDQPKPPLNHKQFGGALGGAVRENETFFFASYEGERIRRSRTKTFSVPTAALRTGDFSGVAPICDPLTIPTTGTCAPFPNGQIPADRVDPVATAFLQKIPLPTSETPFQNLISVEEEDRDMNQFSLRLDHRLTGNDQLFGRFSTYDVDEVQPFGTSVQQEALVPGFGRTLDTSTRNLVASHTHVFGTSMINELRFGWMRVRGGQASLNRGTDFAGQVGLLGVTRDTRDVGFPQISTRNLYSTMGDPTSFIHRDNQHFELYNNFTIDRGSHRWKFGAYWYHLQLRPEQPDNARGAFTYTGQFSGNALADFLLGYPTSATSGIGRGDEDGRTNWVHVYAQDDWRVRNNLTLNVGVRYEYNQHMTDTKNRLSSIDLSVPGGRFVIASDDAGTINPDGQALLPLIPIPYVTSDEAGWGRGLLDPSAVRLAPRVGFALTLDDSRAVLRGGYGIFLNQWAYSVQTAFARNLPFFFTKQVDVPADVSVPDLTTRDILTSNATGTVGASVMDHAFNVEYTQTWSAGLQYELFPATMVEVSYMGSWTVAADNATVRNVPEPGPGSIQARRPIPELSNINAIRFDGRSIYHGLTFKTQRRFQNNYAFTFSYTLSTSKDDASSPGPTAAEFNRPQNVRDIFDGEWAHSSFDHRHQFVASGTYQLPFFADAGGLQEAIFAGWRFNTIIAMRSGSPFTVNLGVDQANVGAGPAQRPDQLRDPNLPRGEPTAERWFDTTAFALPEPYTFGSAPRNSVTGPGFANVDVSIAKTWTAQAGQQFEFRWEIFNLFDRANFDLPNRIFGTPNFGRVFSAGTPREMQFGVRFSF